MNEDNALQMKEKRTNCIRADVIALVCCLLFAVACHGTYILDGKAFVTEGDSLRQMVAATELMDRSLMEGKGLLWSSLYGLGGELYSSLSFYYSTSVFYYLEFGIRAILGIAGDTAGILASKVWFSALRLAAVCILMYALMRQEKNNPALSMLAAFFYGAGSRFMYFSLVFDFMTSAYMMLPLMMLGYNSWRKNGRPWGLIAALALTIATNFYFAYINCLFIGTVFLVMPLRETKDRKEYLRILGGSVLCGIAALLLSAVTFLPSARAFFGSDRGLVSADWSVLPAKSFLTSLWHGMYGYNTYLAYPLMLAASLPALFTKEAKDVRLRWGIAAFWFAAWCIPACRSIMNGFSFPSDRFFYLAAFSAAYALPASIRALEGKERRMGWIFAAGVCFAMLLTAARKFEPESIRERLLFYPALLTGFAGTFAVGVLARKGKIGEAVLPTLASACGISLALLMCGSFTGTYSAERAAQMLEGDGTEQEVSDRLAAEGIGYFRIYDDRGTDGELRTENRSFVTGVPSSACYMSLLSGKLHSWLKQDAQVRCVRVESHYYRGFDDRLFLETAWNEVGKIISEERVEDTNEGRTLAYTSNGIPYLLLDHTVGIDLWYADTMDESIWKELLPAEKDALILKTAAVENGGEQKKESGTEWICVNFENAVLENCTLVDGILWVEEVGGKITVSLPEKRNGEYLCTIGLKTEGNEPFTFSVNGKITEKYGNGYPADYALTFYSVSIPAGTKSAEISISEGKYVEPTLSVGFNSYATLIEDVDALNACGLTIRKQTENRIEGSIVCPETGILALSIPADDGWICTVDGKKAQIITVNGIFPGVRLMEGTHDVRFVYLPRILLMGAVISFLTLAGMAVAVAVTRKKQAERSNPIKR